MELFVTIFWLLDTAVITRLSAVVISSLIVKLTFEIDWSAQATIFVIAVIVGSKSFKIVIVSVWEVVAPCSSVAVIVTSYVLFSPNTGAVIKVKAPVDASIENNAWFAPPVIDHVTISFAV